MQDQLQHLNRGTPYLFPLIRGWYTYCCACAGGLPSGPAQVEVGVVSRRIPESQVVKESFPASGESEAVAGWLSRWDFAEKSEVHGAHETRAGRWVLCVEWREETEQSGAVIVRPRWGWVLFCVGDPGFHPGLFVLNPLGIVPWIVARIWSMRSHRERGRVFGQRGEGAFGCD